MTITEISQTEQEAPAPTVCTVNEYALRRLLSDAVVTASDDAAMPPLHGIVLHTADHDERPVLVATSTDRYIVAQGHVSVAGALPRPLFLSLPYVKTLIGHLGTQEQRETVHHCEVCAEGAEWSNPPGMVELTLSPKGGKLIARIVPAYGDRHETVSIAIPVQTPDSLAASHGKRLAPPDGEPQAGPIVLGPSILAKIVKVADGNLIGVHLTGYGDGKGVLVQVGSHYRAIAMPLRVAPGPGRSSVEIPPVFEIPQS